jgi:hypothetical protein
MVKKQRTQAGPKQDSNYTNRTQIGLIKDPNKVPNQDQKRIPKGPKEEPNKLLIEIRKINLKNPERPELR